MTQILPTCPGIRKGSSTELPRPGASLSEAIGATGQSETGVSRRCGYSPTEFHRWLTGERRIGLEDLERECPRVAAEFYRRRLAMLEAGSSVMGIDEHLTDGIVAQGELHAAVRDARRDGVIDVSERRSIRALALKNAEASRLVAVAVETE